MAKILITGGAGYVGSHCCLALANAGHSVVVFDNLSNGHAAFARWGPLIIGDIRDRERLNTAFRQHRPDAVLHCAGLIEVGESVRRPADFYDINVAGSLTLLRAMIEHRINVFVLSSTCAVYGAPQRLPLREDHPFAPLNPYGWTKLMVEQMSRDLAAASSMRFAHLRYFNAAGAALDHGLGERHEPETHAIPLAIFTALGQRPHFSIFGNDYETRDGTCLRDYVHTLDLADAHVRAIDRLLAGGESVVTNLGGGEGVTVKELVQHIEAVAGKPLAIQHAPRRLGDAASLVADITRANAELGWRARRNITQIVEDAFAWHSSQLYPPASAGAQSRL